MTLSVRSLGYAHTSSSPISVLSTPAIRAHNTELVYITTPSDAFSKQDAYDYIKEGDRAG